MLKGEFIYIWYYFTILFEQIFPYWIVGILIGSTISVFGKNKLISFFEKAANSDIGLPGIVLASLLGILSPICMYGTIPIVASFSKKGLREDWLAAFMMSSVLLNPQLIIYSAVLGAKVLLIRIITSVLCGVLAGILVSFFFNKKSFFNISNLEESSSRDSHPNPYIRLIKSILRNVKVTGVYFFIGILLTAMFQRYVPNESFVELFGKQEGFGILMAASLGVPLYVCGGGTIPLILEWLHRGMGLGAATAFMITGPATKITNLGALKIIIASRNFLFYLLFVLLTSLVFGLLIDVLV